MLWRINNFQDETALTLFLFLAATLLLLTVLGGWFSSLMLLKALQQKATKPRWLALIIWFNFLGVSWYYFKNRKISGKISGVPKL